MITSEQISDQLLQGLLTINAPHEGMLSEKPNVKEMDETLHFLSKLFSSIDHADLTLTRNPHGVMGIEQLQAIIADIREVRNNVWT